MKKLLVVLFLILIVPVTLVIIHKETWAKEKPQVFFFSMQGCSACKQFKPLYEQMASKYSNKFNFIRQDVNTSNLANKLNITSVPAVFIIDPGTQAKTQISYDCLQQQGCFEKKLLNY